MGMHVRASVDTTPYGHLHWFVRLLQHMNFRSACLAATTCECGWHDGRCRPPQPSGEDKVAPMLANLLGCVG